MTAIHVDVTAEDIAAAPRIPETGDGWQIDTPEQLDPVELAIARVTGQPTQCDEDGPEDDEMATIGGRRGSRNVLVLSTAPTVGPWIARFYKGEPVEPFSFDIPIEDWLVALVAKASTTDEQAAAVMAMPDWPPP